MPRQPLFKLVRRADDAGYSIGQGPHLFEPATECTRLIGCCLASWADVQVQFSTLLSVLLGGHTDAAYAVYLTMRLSQERRQIIIAAANVTLTGRNLELFEALMVALDSIEDERNALAHGIFAYYPKLGDAVLWIDPVDWAKYQAKSIKNAENGIADPNELWDIKEKAYVYRPNDLKQIYEDILALRTATLSFFKFIRMGSPDDRYRQLCSVPLIRRAIAHVRANPKKMK